MAKVKYKAIIVTGWSVSGDVQKARQMAIEIFKFLLDEETEIVGEIIHSPANQMCSFLIAPDASGDGFDTAENAKIAREQFTLWLDVNKFGIDYVQVEFGGDDTSAYVTKTN